MAYEEIFTAPCLNERWQVQRLEPAYLQTAPIARGPKYDIQQRD